MTRGAVLRALRLPALLGAGLSGFPLGLLAIAGARHTAVRLWCAAAGRAVGLHVGVRGAVPPSGCLVAANHVGYLDPLALGSVVPGRFLAKSEVARWPLLGMLSRWGGVQFVQRDRPRAVSVVLDAVARCVAAGERTLVFPEARVSPDGLSVGPFHPMVFEASVRSGCPVVPAALCYTYPRDPRVWGWFDEPSLWHHLWTRVLPAERIEVEVRFGKPLWPEPGADRKLLAASARSSVLELMEQPPLPAQTGSRP
jgi:1-acyl-sn-glycerol-3-phosphate acyltransferase